MGVELTKEGVDLGIVTNNGEAMMTFYRDTLGFDHEGDIPFPLGGTMHRLWCGRSLIKIVVPEPPVTKKPEPGPITSAGGYRYWTISVSNLEELVAACQATGCNVPVEPREIRPGVTIAMVEDPDGNWVELLQNG